MKPLIYLWTLGLVLIATPLPQASGSYTSRPPTPPTKSVKADRAKYDLGQKIFTGKTKPVQTDAAGQRPRLETLQSRLPAYVAAKKNLPTLAGTLSEEQLTALEHYVGERYPVK